MRPRTQFRLLIAIVLAVFMVTGPGLTIANAGVNDVLFGVASSQDMIDFSQVNSSTFGSYFTYYDSPTSSLTIGGNVEAQIGAIWIGGTQGVDWRQVRIVIDSNGDGELTPFDWSDSSHPWNPPTNPPNNGDSWTYTYPSDYPRTELRGQQITITVTVDQYGWYTDFPWETWEQWWYEGNADKTDNWWMESGQLMNIWWSGRDQNWNMLPNGDYKVQVWVDENDNGQFEDIEANKTLVITIQTANITGTVQDAGGNPIMGARVEAGSYMAWGEARTRSDGTFTISGLQADADNPISYHVRVQADGKVTRESDVQMAAGATTASAGTLTMSDAVTITGTIQLDRDGDGTAGESVDDAFSTFINQWGWMQSDMWVWVNANNTQGPGWGNIDVRFEDPDFDGPQVGPAEMTFTVSIPPPESNTIYRLNLNADGYVATINGQNVNTVDIPVTTSGGNIDAIGPIVLTKASRLFGSVLLPAAITDWRSIDVQAVSTTNSDDRYWGWGNIYPYFNGGSATDTGQFAIDGIPEGTYRLEVRVMGYAINITNDVVVVQGQDKDMGQLTIAEGSKISGTLHIGDTTNLQRWDGDNSTELDIWIDAWSPTGGWSGTNLRFTRGAPQDVLYSLGGLSDATYEVHCWLGEGFELVDANGESPVLVTVSGATTANLQLKAHEGVIQGTVSFDAGVDTNVTGVDLSHVLVEAKRPWDWMPPKYTAVDPSTGAYSISGLGTGDYVVKIGVYQGFMDYQGNMNTDLSLYTGSGFLVPSSEVGVVLQRTFVQNNANAPTTVNAVLEQGYTISGTVRLSGTDAPWEDFGDGAGGEPDGIKNTTDPNYDERITIPADVAGLPVSAMPMDMMFMGGEDPRMGMIQTVNPTTGTYSISGLAPGVYMLMPPFSSRRIDMIDGSGPSGGYIGGQVNHHWTVSPQTVVVSAANAVDGEITGIDFELANGHTVTGNLTLPEAQTDDGSWDTWVGHLELETPQHQFMGHGMPLFKEDFNGGSRYAFTFNHVADGDYLVRFWTDRYVPGGKKFTVNNANASVNLTIETGANLVGKLVDAETGEAVTGNDGVRVRCEAVPFVEGSWRETQNDDWSKSYIEDGEALMSGGSGTGERENNTPGKFHLTALPTGAKYVVVVETSNGKKTNGAKNYVGRVIAGIEIPDGANGDISIGTIKLTEGTTIQGRLTDSNGNGIAGVDVFAMPSNSHDGSSEAEGTSDTNGYYTVYGINPNVAYYDLIAAERPDMFDDWGKQVQWGEKRKYNVPPETMDANFTLVPATASLSGNLTIPSGSEFMIPFKGEANEFPATIVMLQRKGVIYKDVMDGIEVMSAPAPSGALTTTYTIDNIAPGTFKAIFMNYGLPTRIVDDVVIAEGSNTLDVTWTSAGYTVSGGLALDTGGYPTSADINGVLCMNTNDQSLTFGILTAEADGSYSAYEVPGLASGQTYQLVFYKESGFDGPPEIFTAGSAFTVTGDITGSTATISRNGVPIFMAQAVQSATNSNLINIGIFSTGYLNDESVEIVTTAPTEASAAGQIFVSQGGGSLSNVILSGDKRSLSASYAKDSADSTVTLTLAVHYGDDDTTLLKQISFNVNTLAKNQDSVSVYIPGSVKLGNGDASQIYVPAGSLDTSDDGQAIVTIEKTDEEPGALSAESREAAATRGIFARSARAALPDTATAAGNQYDFSVNAADESATVSQVGSVTVQIQYDPDLVDDVDQLQIMHLVGGSWQTETTNRTVDTENHTISADVTSLSPFLAAVVRSEDSGGDDTGGDTGSSSSSGGSSGGCFISTTAPEMPGLVLLFGICLLAMLAGLKMVLSSIHDGKSK